MLTTRTRRLSWAAVPTTLAELTTLRLGGHAERFETATTAAELIDAVQQADAAGESVLLLGGGSNLVVGDDGWPGLVVRVASDQVRTDGETLTVDAGVEWDALVRRTLDAGLSGLETMSGIPGLVGATPVQNVGAYGAEVADVLTALTIFDRETKVVETWSPESCQFGFRTSAFKHTDRYLVLDVTIRLVRSAESRPVGYLELARRLGIAQGESAPAEKVRETVLELRRSKGMVLDADDHDSWSVGSFFVNPLLDVVPEAAEAGARWQTEGRMERAVAWLIDQAGVTKG